MSDDLKKVRNMIETEVMETLDNPYSAYSVKFAYTCSFSFPEDDHHTKVTIETVKECVRFGRSDHDVSLQVYRDQELSRHIYAKHVLQWVSRTLYSIEPEDVEITYGDNRSIDLITDEEIEDFIQRCLEDD
jgi:hypothetical protein